MTSLARRIALLTAAITLLLTPSAFAARGFSLGVAAGHVTADSAILRGKANKSGRYTPEVRPTAKRGPGFERRGALLYSVRARAGNDDTLQRKVGGLDPDTRYRYRFTGRRGRRSDWGVFRTAPRPRANDTIEFAWTGD